MSNGIRTRLEEILGKPLAEISWRDLEALVEARVQEAQDLEFKATHYGNTDSSKRDLAKDIAAFANTVGGVLVIGITEDNQGCATELTPVLLEEGQITRYHQIVAGQVRPLINFETLNITDPSDQTRGVLLVIVGRSGLAPHAVTINESLGYPRRHDRVIVNLTEHEVAIYYAERSRLVQSRIEIARTREKEFVKNLDPSYEWFVMSLTPDFPGMLTLNEQIFLDFRGRFLSKLAGVPWTSLVIDQVKIRHRRIFMSDVGRNGFKQPEWIALELHSDGSGFFASRLSRFVPRHEISVPEGVAQVWMYSDEEIVNALLSALQQLGGHSWSAGSQGLANITVRLWSNDYHHPIALGHEGTGGAAPLGEYQFDRPICEVIAPLESLRIVGKDLLKTAFLLLQEMCQAMGVIQTRFITSEGSLVLDSWGVAVHNEIKRWCVDNDLDRT